MDAPSPPRLILAVLTSCLVAVPRSAAQQPPPGAPTAARPLTPQQQERLRERDRLWKEMQRLRAAGQLPQAIAALEKVLAIEREILGRDHEDVAGSLQTLAGMREQQGEFAAARQARREVLQIRVQRNGQDHWRTGDARRALAQTELLERLTPAQRAELARAEGLNTQVIHLYRQGKFTGAVSAARQVLQIRKEVLGEKHPDYAHSLNNLAALYRDMGDHAKAEPLFKEALAIRKDGAGGEASRLRQEP